MRTPKSNAIAGLRDAARRITDTSCRSLRQDPVHARIESRLSLTHQRDRLHAFERIKQRKVRYRSAHSAEDEPFMLHERRKRTQDSRRVRRWIAEHLCCHAKR